MNENLRDLAESLFDASPDAIVLFDREGVVCAINDAACELVGYSREEVLGVHVVEMVRRSDGPRVSLAREAALAGGTEHFETTARHRDGTIIPIECAIYPARRDGKIVGVYAQVRDAVALREIEATLQRSQQRARSLFEFHPDGIMELKAGGTISRVNVALESETGYFGEHIVGRPWTELIAPECREQAGEAFRASARGEATEIDSLLLDRLGNRLDIQLKLVPLASEGEITGAYAIAKNITAQKTAERAMAVQSERIRELYLVAAARGETLTRQIEATLALGCRLFDFDYSYVVRFDDRQLTIEYLAEKEPLFSRGVSFALDRTFARHVAESGTTVMVPDLGTPPWCHDLAYKILPWRSYFGTPLAVGGQSYGALVFAGRKPMAHPMLDSDRDLVALMTLFVAAAIERARHEERIEQLAFNDLLTGLPNRVLLDDRLRQTLATAKRYNRGFSIFFLDLDNFKEVNDTFGHGAGDAVLVAVAGRLRDVLRESDTVARIGGDEFVILQPVVDGPNDAADLAHKLTNAMQQPIVIDGREHAVHASIGIAMYPDDGTDTETLMRQADQALYRAKGAGRNRWFFANEERVRRAMNRR